MQTVLRPLTIGELFDRAVTLFIRHFSIVSLVVLCFVVPVTVFDAVIGNDMSHVLRQIQTASKAPPGQPPDPVMLQSMLQHSSLLTLLFVFILIGAALVYAAVAVTVGRIYEDAKPEFRSVWKTTLRAFPTIMALSFLQIAVIIGWVVALVPAIIVITLVGASAGALGPVGRIVAGVLIVVAMIAWFWGLLMLVIAMTFSYFAAAVERKGIGSAMSGAFAQVFGGGNFRRVSLVALAFGAAEIATLLVASVIEFTAASLVRSEIVNAVIEAGLSLLTYGFLATLLAVLYYDARARREGVDLQPSSSPLVAP